MRIQILPLPSVVKGDDVEEPFAIVVDQAPRFDELAPKDHEAWQGFAAACGARALLTVPDTMEIVDRYAELPPPTQVHVAEMRINGVEDLDPEKVKRDLRVALGRCADCGKRPYRCECRTAEPGRSLMDDLPPEVRPLAAAVGIPDRPVDLRERAREWIVGFLAATDDDRVNTVALMLGAADDAIRCAVNHKAAEGDDEGDEQEQGLMAFDHAQTLEDAGEKARQALGIDGTMGDAQDVPHAYDDNEGTAPYCVVCGLWRLAGVHKRCRNCGKPYSESACGPGHAMAANEIEQYERTTAGWPKLARDRSEDDE